jgi:hypothetical protein
LSKNDAIDLLVRSHSRTYSTSESNTHAIFKLVIENHLLNPENFKNITLSSLIDLLIYFQRPDKRINEFRSKIIPLIEDRTRTLTQGYLQNYIRRVINITDVVPSFENLTVVQSRNILEFLAAQENIKNMTPPLLYTLVHSIITDAKLSVRNMPNDVSFSKLFEKHRIEGNINALLNKIPKEEGQVTENFIEALFFQNANLPEVPSYFIKTLKNVISNGIPTNAKTEIPVKPAEETS